MNFTVTREEDLIVITINLPSLKKNPLTGIDTNRTVLKEHVVRKYLADSKINAGECLIKDDIDNMGDRLTAVWKFKASNKKTVDKATSPVVSSNSAKRTKKSPKPKDE